MVIMSGFEFLILGEVVLGIKIILRTKKKSMRLFRKILSKWTLFFRKMQKILCFYEFMAMLRMENFLKCHKVNIYANAHMNIKYLDFLKIFDLLELTKS